MFFFLKKIPLKGLFLHIKTIPLENLTKFKQTAYFLTTLPPQNLYEFKLLREDFNVDFKQIYFYIRKHQIRLLFEK
jgi:hypothetical protein